MRWPLIVTLAFGINSPAQVEAAEGYYEDGAGKNDDTSVVDRCENISPYTKRQIVQHIQLNSKDLTKLDSRFEAESRKRDSKADSVDKALVDLQRKFTLLSEQREQDKLRYEAKITNLEKLLSDYKKEVPDMINSALRQQKLDMMVSSVTNSYQQGQISVYRERDTVVVKKRSVDSGSCRAIIFGHRGVTRYTLTMGTFMHVFAGWSVPSKTTDSMQSYHGSSGWKSAGVYSYNGWIYYYDKKDKLTTGLPKFMHAGQSITTAVDYAGKFFIFETSGQSYTTSFSSLNMVPESAEDPQFYPALSIYSRGDVIISNIEFENNN